MSATTQLVTSHFLDSAQQIAHIRLNRPEKRNALSDNMVASLHTAFLQLADSVRVVVLSGEGAHFCSGLDLSELTERDAVQGVHHSRGWHRAFQDIEYGKVPVISVLHGAVAGGGLELATATHIRVAESSAYYAMPEGQRGIYVGGGASVRVPKLIGVHRMMDMMLTGRLYKSEEGQQLGISNYLVGEGEGLARAQQLAERICGNTRVTNYAVTHVLPRIGEMTAEHGLLMESLMAGIAGNSPEAKQRLAEFLSGRANKIKPE
jgi:(methylthio)acryloyl-CoA hydratase